MTDWIAIKEAADAELAEQRAQRQRLQAAEDRAVEREQRTRKVAAAKPTPAPRELTREEKRANAAEVLNAWALQQPVADAPSPSPAADAPKPVAGTMTAKLAKREERHQARATEQRTAAETLATWLGNQRNGR